MEIEVPRTPIQSFYAEQSIFITGGTGFLGNVLTEKLLRSCPDISTIYLLIRAKKDKCPENRLDEMFEKPLYDRVRKEVPNFRKKVVPIVGDFDIGGIGLSENDKNLLINKVTVVFHLAAIVRFNEKIKISTFSNVNAVATIIQLATRMPNLKSFIHVSTAFSNSHVQHIDERFYSYPITHNDLIMLTRNFSENIIEEKLSSIMSQWPNTYAFTKAIAEGLLRYKSEDLPIGIFRPAVVSSSASEPLVGWIDNKYGPVGMVMALFLGIQRVIYFNSNLKANIVPVDFTVNALIASAWDVSDQRRKGKHMLIYNFVPPVDGPTWSEYFYALFDINKMYPLNKAKYLPMYVFIQRKMSYIICICLGHFLPAFFVDAANICLNRSPRMWKLYTKIHKASKTIQTFSRNWSFSTDNVQGLWEQLSEQDQQLFKFSLVGFNWKKYFIDHYKGIRLYLLNEDDSTLEINRTKHKRFYWMHQTFKTVLIFAILWIVWIVFRIICT